MYVFFVRHSENGGKPLSYLQEQKLKKQMKKIQFCLWLIQKRRKK